MRRFQDMSHLLELVYQAAQKMFGSFHRWLTPGWISERVFIFIERLSKGALFDCRVYGVHVIAYYQEELVAEIIEQAWLLPRA